MDQLTISEDWIRKKLNITHDNLEDIKSLSLAGTYQEKISYLGNALHKFTRLKELDLSRNSLMSLEGLENCKQLEKLNLYYNNISSLKELERLRFNNVLGELDLRLNPITKEENDYRLYLIHILPSLKIFDDRAIRDSERQMASTYFEQKNSLISSSISSSLSSTSSSCSTSDNVKINGNINHNNNNPVALRIKSVSNIAKRSAGIIDQDEKKYQNKLNLRMHDDYYTTSSGTNGGTVNQQEQYSPNDFESNSYTTLSNQPPAQSLEMRETNNYNFLKSKSCSMQNLRAITNSSDTNNNNNNLQPNKSKSVHFNEIASYHDLNSYRSSSDNNLNAYDESDAFNNFKSRGSFTANPAFYENNNNNNNNQTHHHKSKRMSRDLTETENNEASMKLNLKIIDESKGNQLFMLLDLVDRYWNGSKSLHQNPKFLAAASQLLQTDNQYDNFQNEEFINTLQSQLRVLQEENKRLQNQLIQKSINRSSNENGSNGETSTELQHKNLLAELDILKKKLITSQEENKKLQKEFAEKSEKIHKEYSLENYESQNGTLKREIEIMRIKLKQYEQLQQLTGMLQESHKSLVTTNEHLLQEISNHKRSSHSRNHHYTNNNNHLINNKNNNNNNTNLNTNTVINNDLILYSPNQLAQQREMAANLVYANNGIVPNGGNISINSGSSNKQNGNHVNGKPNKQQQQQQQHFEQINNNRYSYSVVK